MVAAVVGAAAPIPLTSPVQDESYLLAGADRFTRIAAGEQTDLFPYPDLLRWRPPRSGLDSVGLADNRLALASLAWLTPQGPPHIGRDETWQWTVASFGPRLLVKHRRELRPLPTSNWPGPRPTRPSQTKTKAVHAPAPVQTASAHSDLEPPLIDADRDDQLVTQPQLIPSMPIDLVAVRQWLERNNYEDRAVGYALRSVAESGTDDQVDDFFQLVKAEIRKRIRRSSAGKPSNGRAGSS
jgi:hypothetical protein